MQTTTSNTASGKGSRSLQSTASNVIMSERPRGQCHGKGGAFQFGR